MIIPFQFWSFRDATFNWKLSGFKGTLIFIHTENLTLKQFKSHFPKHRFSNLTKNQ